MISDFYQNSKPVILELFSLTKDAIHIHVGFLAFILAFIFFKRLRFSWKLLLFPLGLSLTMEILDAISDLGRVHRLLPPAYLHDLINTNFIPIVLTLVYTFIQRGNRAEN
jgi:hypothetical protein